MTKVSICAIIKDEQRYLQEWIEYHLKLGFDDIYLYEDYGSKPHNSITDKFDNVHLFPLSISGMKEGNELRQNNLYWWFTKEYKDKMDWCAFIDIDEFIHIDNCNDIHILCDAFKDSKYNGFVLYWKMFNASGHIKRPEGKLIDVYTEESPLKPESWSEWTYKPIINMHRDIQWTNCHNASNICDISNNRIDMRSWVNKPIHNPACIYHYFTKSWEDFKERLERGNITKGIRYINTFFKNNPDLLYLKETLTNEN